MSRFSLSQGGNMLSEIKSKLGFSDGAQRSSRDDYDYDDYDDYDGYDDDSYRDPYKGDYAYDNSSPVTLRGSSTSGGRREASRPRLVSFEDVRAATQVPDSLSHDPLAARHVVTTSDQRPGPTAREVAVAAAKMGSPSSVRSSASSAYKQVAASVAASSQSASGAASGHGYDPYRAYQQGSASTPVFSPERSLTVLKPTAYEEVEQIAKSLKAGDAVILQLHNTSSALSKRVLDFSFGVSSALDASVDCIADKVFVITRGKELTDEERTKLRNQGVY